MKKLISSVCSILLAAAAIGDDDNHYTDNHGVVWTHYRTGSKVIIAGASPCSGNLVVPSLLINTIGVRLHAAAIASGAFSNCTQLSSIAIPRYITSIGNNAFYGCAALTTVYYSTASRTDIKTLMTGKGLNIDLVDFIPANQYLVQYLDTSGSVIGHDECTINTVGGLQKTEWTGSAKIVTGEGGKRLDLPADEFGVVDLEITATK